MPIPGYPLTFDPAVDNVCHKDGGQMWQGKKRQSHLTVAQKGTSSDEMLSNATLKLTFFL